MLFYSKCKLINPKIRFLLKDSIPSMHTMVMLPNQEIIELHIIHPTPPLPPHDASSTDRDAQMMMVAKMAEKSRYPVIVTGDFNDVAWSETTSLFQKVSQLLDPRIGRGFYNTFNANNWFIRWPLDHLFMSKEFRLIDMELGKDVGSDHFPLHIKLSLEPQNDEEQKMPEPSKKEMEKADKQIENQAEKEQKEKQKED
jgi:endonuclease/exonuclease/phosphatase (EEP) superfamily protein YafD